MNLRREFIIALLLALTIGTIGSCRNEDPLTPQLEKLVQARKETVPEERIVLGEKSKPKRREIEILVNIIAPDSEYQPWYLADEADLFAVRDQSEKIIRPRLEGYFGKPLKFEIRHRQPLWELVDEIKKLYPDWPDGWE
jgi:hypothetical protein